MKKESPKHPFVRSVEQIPIIAIKGFVGCLAIGFPLELIGIDILGTTTIQTHFFEYVGGIFAVGLPLHYFIWRTNFD